MLCFLINTEFSFANQLDSLTSLLNKSKDSTKVDLLNKICWEYIYNEPQKALYFAKQAKQLAGKLNYLKGLADANTRIGIVYDVTSKYDSAIYYYNQSLYISKKLNNKKGIGSAYSNLGLAYWNKGSLSKALEFYLMAIPEFDAINDSINLGNNYNNIGLIYFDLKDFKKAKTYFLKSNIYNIATNNQRTLAASYSNIGTCFDDEKKYTIALDYYNKSLFIKRKINDSYGIAITLVDIGLLYYNLKNYDKAIEYLNEGLDYKILVKDEYGEAATLTLLAEVYKIKKLNAESLNYYLKAQKIGEKINNFKLLVSIYKNISELYETSNSNMAYLFLNKHLIAKDSLKTQENKQYLNELTAKYETEAKEKKIALLQQKNTINELAIEKNKQQKNIIGLVSLIAITIILSFYFVFRSKQKIKSEQEKLRLEKINTSTIIIAQEQERKRISEELHDGVGQLLSAIKLNICALDNSENEKIKNAIILVDSSCEEIRNISHNLMPYSLSKVGLLESIKEFAKKINSSGKVNIQVGGELDEKSILNKEIHLYRIIQEVLNNSLKHANASIITIQFNDEKNEVSVSIEDNGIGFNKEVIDKSKGNGWANIKSRLAIINGSFEIDSKINKGTAMHIYIAKS